MFEVGSDQDHHSHTPNLWPPEEMIPNFSKEWMELFWTLQELNKNMMKTVSLALGLEMDALDYLINEYIDSPKIKYQMRDYRQNLME